MKHTAFLMGFMFFLSLATLVALDGWEIADVLVIILILISFSFFVLGLIERAARKAKDAARGRQLKHR